MNVSARVDDNSQFDGNCAVFIGSVSVCPLISTRSGTDANSPATIGPIR